MTEVFDYWARTHRHAPRDATSRGIASAMKLTLLVALTALALPGLSRAGGLYLGDFGTPSMGTAGAGANARADDASAAFHGPAGMTRLDEHQLMLGAAPGFATVKFDPDAGTPTPGTNGGQQGGFIPILSRPLRPQALRSLALRCEPRLDLGFGARPERRLGGAQRDR